MTEDRSWINEGVEGEIQSFQDRFGFNREEAIAIWHLNAAARVMVGLNQADKHIQWAQEEEAGRTFDWMDMSENWDELNHTILIPISTLKAELGRRVLRRSFPDGWGRHYNPRDPKEEAD